MASKEVYSLSPRTLQVRLGWLSHVMYVIVCYSYLLPFVLRRISAGFIFNSPKMEDCIDGVWLDFAEIGWFCRLSGFTNFQLEQYYSSTRRISSMFSIKQYVATSVPSTAQWNSTQSSHHCPYSSLPRGQSHSLPWNLFRMIRPLNLFFESNCSLAVCYEHTNRAAFE